MSDRETQEVSDNIINNAGLGHSANAAGIWYQNFCHRSFAEALITKSLINHDVLFSPLPVFSCRDGRRREIDHLVFSDSYCVLQEVDGDSHSEELHFDGEERLRVFRERGFFICRYRSPLDPSLAWADECVEKTLLFIQNLVRYFGRRK